MGLYQEIEETRINLIHQIDIAFERLSQRVLELELQEETEEPIGNFETVYPLSAEPSVFKGRKPTGVFLGEQRVDVPTWKMLFKKVMLFCNEDRKTHAMLMDLRGKITGRDRVLLSQTDEGMRSPICIDKNLYVETHYDTETLLRILTARILDAVAFDYSNIRIAIRNR